MVTVIFPTCVSYDAYNVTLVSSSVNVFQIETNVQSCDVGADRWW